MSLNILTKSRCNLSKSPVKNHAFIVADSQQLLLSVLLFGLLVATTTSTLPALCSSLVTQPFMSCSVIILLPVCLLLEEFSFLCCYFFI